MHRTWQCRQCDGTNNRSNVAKLVKFNIDGNVIGQRKKILEAQYFFDDRVNLTTLVTVVLRRGVFV